MPLQINTGIRNIKKIAFKKYENRAINVDILFEDDCISRDLFAGPTRGFGKKSIEKQNLHPQPSFA